MPYYNHSVTKSFHFYPPIAKPLYSLLFSSFSLCELWSKKAKMLAVFDKSVAKSPEALQSPQSESVSTLKDGFLANHFGSLHPGSVTVNLASSGLIAYSLQNKNPLLPRYSTIYIPHFSYAPTNWKYGISILCFFLVLWFSGWSDLGDSWVCLVFGKK